MQAKHIPQILLFTLVLSSTGIFIARLRAHRFATATIGLIVPDEPVASDEPVDVDIWIFDADNVGAFEVRLEYNRSLVEIVEVESGDYLGPSEGCDPEVERCASYLSALNEDGLTSLGAFTFGSGDGRSGDGRLATLRLQPTGTPGTVTLHFKNVILLDTEANELPVSSQDATLTFQFPDTIYLPIVSH